MLNQWDLYYSRADTCMKLYKYHLSLYISNNMWPWSTKAVLSRTGIFIEIDNNTLYESKLSIFRLCQKSLGCSMMIFSTFPIVNISKFNFLISNMHCYELHLDNFKGDFLNISFFFCTLRFQIFKYCSIITNHTSMERLYIQLSDDAYISISKIEPYLGVLWSRVTYIS